MPLNRRSSAARHRALAAVVVLAPAAAQGAIIASGNTIPPFNLPDTIGSTKVATVDPGGTSHGGVIVGDSMPGTLTVDNGWTLNSLFGVVANDTAGNGASGSRMTMSDGSTWNISGDLDVGKGGNGFLQLNHSTLSAIGQVRSGTNAGAPGNLALLASHMTAGSVVAGVSGGGTVTIDGSSLDTQFIEVGRELPSVGNLILSGATVHDIGGLSVGIRGNGSLLFGNGTSVTTDFAVFGNDTAVGNAQSAGGPSVGSARITGPGADWQNANGFIVAFNSRGSVSLSGGATLATGFLEISRYGADGSFTVDNSSVSIGGAGTPSMIIGTEAKSVGRATFTGTNASLTVGAGGFLEVGRHAASAQLDFNGGAHASVTDTIIATEQDGTGGMNLSGAGTNWAASSDFEVARNGHGTLNVMQGAVLSSLSGRVAEGATSVGSATLSDPGTRWDMSTALEVGGSGSGTLTSSNGATVTTGTFVNVGANAGGKGTVDLSGGTSLTSANQLQVGGDGAGTLVVRGGAHVDSKKGPSPTNSSGLIGRNSDGSGAVTVTGMGSLWTNDGMVNVGFAGPGTLTIDSGGRVESSDGVIARLPGSKGTVALTGVGSTWSIGQSLYVGGRPASAAGGDAGMPGFGGAASLSATGGAVVSVGSAVRLFSTQSTVDVSGGGSVAVGPGSNAEAGAVHVFTGGTLSGTGNVKGNLVNGGIVNVTTLSVAGNYRQTSSGLLGLSVTGPGANSSLAATGIATLGGTLELDFPNFTPAAGQTFRLVMAPAVSGDFGSVVTAGLLSGWKYTLTRDAQGLLLTSLGSATADVPGDANGDGTVNFTDLLAVAQHFGQPGLLSQGDFNGDGTVTFADLLLLAQNYGKSARTPAGADAVVAPVPEPSALALLSAAGTLLCRRRRGR